MPFFNSDTIFSISLSLYCLKFPPYFAVDNGKMRWGTKVYGVDVKAPSAILDVPAQERNVVICCMYYDAISAQLKAMGVEHSEFQDRYFV